MFKLNKIFLTITIVLTGLFGCNEIEINTKVAPNGKLTRLISVSGDSSGVGESGYPIPNDSSWTIKGEKNPDDPKKLLWTISKIYKNENELNEDFVKQDGVLFIDSKVEVDKKFRWIYTYYTYQETVQELGPILVFPDSASMLVYRAKRDTIDDIEKWSDEFLFESFFQTLLFELEKQPVEGLSPEFVKSKRDTLFVVTEDFDGDFDNLVNSLLTDCKQIFQLENAEPLRPILDVYWQKFEKYLNFIERSIGEEYKNNVEMPGQIIDTNADKIEGNKALWEFGMDDFEIENLVMRVESRNLNLFPTGLTILIILLSITIVVYLTVWETLENRVAERRRNNIVLNKWVSILLVVLGFCIFIFGMILTVSMWKWTMVFFEMITWKDRVLFVFIDLVGLVLLLTGVIHLIKSKTNC